MNLNPAGYILVYSNKPKPSGYILVYSDKPKPCRMKEELICSSLALVVYIGTIHHQFVYDDRY